MYKDFEEDFKENYSDDEFNIIDRLLFELFENNFDEKKVVSGEWDISVSVEKINSLQENIFISFSKDDNNFSLEYENGINNGTQLNDYSFNSDLKPLCRIQDILDDIVLDKEKIQLWQNEKIGKVVDVDWKFAQLFLDKHKTEILKILKNQNYDNYATGGGTNKTDSHYKNLKSKFNDKGLFWIVEYKQVESNVNWK